MIMEKALMVRKQFSSLRKVCFAGCCLCTLFALLCSITIYKGSSSGNNRSLTPLLTATKTTEDEYSYRFEDKSPAAPHCYQLFPNDIDFTYVVQLSPNRLWLMEHHCKRWDGPMSIAVGGNLPKQAILKLLERMGCDTARLQVGVIETPIDSEYPVNQLRNLALSKIKTSHAVFIDADFMLAPGLYQNLLNQRDVLAIDSKVAMVLPAFELRSFCADKSAACHSTLVAAIPESKKELMEMMVAEELVTPFDSRGNYHGHGSTDYIRWKEQDPDELIEIECITSPRYEPYLVIRYCRDMPPFQEAFRGYGMNKYTWSQHLRRVGYRFYQVGHSFVVHFPHPKSSAWKKWNRERGGVEWIGKAFSAWMETTVPDHSVVPYCEDEDNTSFA